MPVVAARGDLTATGVAFVLKSLTPNHRTVLRILAKYIVQNSSAVGTMVDLRWPAFRLIVVLCCCAVLQVWTCTNGFKVVSTIWWSTAT